MSIQILYKCQKCSRHYKSIYSLRERDGLQRCGKESEGLKERVGFCWERGLVHPEPLKEKMVENVSRKAYLGCVEGFK